MCLANGKIRISRSAKEKKRCKQKRGRLLDVFDLFLYEDNFVNVSMGSELLKAILITSDDL